MLPPGPQVHGPLGGAPGEASLCGEILLFSFPFFSLPFFPLFGGLREKIVPPGQKQGPGGLWTTGAGLEGGGAGGGESLPGFIWGGRSGIFVKKKNRTQGGDTGTFSVFVGGGGK